MRELKFRAWANGYEKWCHRIEYIDDGLWLGYVDDGVGELSTTDIVVEQYTGLQDKNGKEIYEGDIVKLTGKVAKNKGTLYKVVWDNFLTGFDLISLERSKEDIGYLNEVEMEERYKVIGNIHENPELLK